MHEAAGMHLISTCTGNEVGSNYVLTFGSWITFVSCNALGVTLHIGIGDRTMDNEKQLIILIVMMIIDSYQRLKDPYNKSLKLTILPLLLNQSFPLCMRTWFIFSIGLD